MADFHIPLSCTDCGGAKNGASWTSEMMFDDENEAPKADYGDGADFRTTWIRQSFDQ